MELYFQYPIRFYGAYRDNVLFFTQYSFFSRLKPIGNIRSAKINIHKFYVLSTQCIYVFGMDLRTNSICFPTQH